MDDLNFPLRYLRNAPRLASGVPNARRIVGSREGDRLLCQMRLARHR